MKRFLGHAIFAHWFWIILASIFLIRVGLSVQAGTFFVQHDPKDHDEAKHPSVPRDLKASPVSPTEIKLSWHKSHDPQSDKSDEGEGKDQGEDKGKDKKDRDDNNGVVGYRVFRNGVQIAQVSGTSYLDMNLVPKTTYVYTVAAVDAAGNVSALSKSVSATTFPDTTPPTVPTGLTATPVSTSQINLAWIASSDPDSPVAGYKIYRNSVQVGTSTTTSFSDTGLSPSTSYSYTVSAFDAAGNDSGQSSAVSAMTQALAISTTPTLVQAVSTSNTQGNFVNVYTVRLPNATLSHNCVILAVQSASTGRGGAGSPAVSDDAGNTYNLAIVNDDRIQAVSVFYALNTIAGAQKITLTFSGAGSFYVSAAAAEFYNVVAAGALDGMSGSVHGATDTSVTAGSLTTTADNDLIFQYATQYGTNAVWTQGASPWSLLTADYFQAQASQYQIQTAKGAINPTLQQDSSKQFNSVAIALKSGSAGTPPSGIHVVHLIHNLVPPSPNNTFSLQTPSTGNLLVLQWIGVGGCDISTVSDSKLNNYVSTGPPLGNNSGGSSGDLQTFFVGSAQTSPSLSGPTITIPNTAPCGSSTNALVYDVAGAAASPYDSVAGRATAAGNQAIAGPLTTVSITPSTPNGLIITQTGVDAHTLTGVTPGNFLATEPTPDINTGALDNNNGWALYYNTGTSPVTFVYSTKSGAVSAWASIAVAFKGQ